MKHREYIIAAACVVRTEEFLPPSVQNRNIRIGSTHTAILRENRDAARKVYQMEDTKGFLTSKLRFVNRWEAMKVAKAAGQVDSEQFALFSDILDLKPYYERYLSETPEMAQQLNELEIQEYGT